MRSVPRIGLVAAVAVAFVLATGCATKKYVQNTINPVEKRVSDLDKRTTEQGTSINELDTKVSRVDEKAITADSKAAAAAQDAARANDQAALAGKSAADARSLAEQGIGKADQANAKIENYDNYTTVFENSVVFKFGKSELDDEAKATLDTAAGKIAGTKHFVIEVRGFTDTTGSKSYNLELSRKRAAAVVRYLTADKNIPLYRIHTLGYGSESPVADNKTRDGRGQNRRVEVKCYAANLGGEKASF